MAIIQPFDFEKIILITLAGSTEIFAFLMIIAMAVAGAYFKFTNTIFLILLAIFGLIMSGTLGGIYILVLLLVGLITFNGVSRIIKN